MGTLNRVHSFDQSDTVVMTNASFASDLLSARRFVDVFWLIARKPIIRQ